MESNEESSEVEQINTSSRNVSKARKSLSKVATQIGQKRKRSVKGKNHRDEEDEDDALENEESHAISSYEDASEGASQVMKKRKMSQGKEQKVKSAKKAPKMPTVFKKGKWNPDVELIDIDKYKEGKEN